MPTALGNVRFQGQRGRHMLALSSSQFDPPQTLAAIAGDAPHLHLPQARPKHPAGRLDKLPNGQPIHHARPMDVVVRRMIPSVAPKT
jgi:hypothetical protein